MRRRWGSLPDLEVKGRNGTSPVDESTHSNLSSSSRSCMKVRSLDESLSLSWSEAKRLASSLSAPTIEESDNELQVSFYNVDIREYELAVGDNPSCTFGVPITMGWKYNESSVPLDDYETARPSEVRRTQKQMLLPSSVREARLKEAGAARRDMARAVRETTKIKSKRSQTVNNMGTTARFEMGLESGMRKLKRAIFRRKKESQEWEEWKKEYAKKVEQQEARFGDNSITPQNNIDQQIPKNSKRIVIEEDDEEPVLAVVEVRECATASVICEDKLQTTLSTDDFDDTTGKNDTIAKEETETTVSSDDITTNQKSTTSPTSITLSHNKESAPDNKDQVKRNGAMEKIVRKSTESTLDTILDEKKDDNHSSSEN